MEIRTKKKVRRKQYSSSAQRNIFMHSTRENLTLCVDDPIPTAVILSSSESLEGAPEPILCCLCCVGVFTRLFYRQLRCVCVSN